MMFIPWTRIPKDGKIVRMITKQYLIEHRRTSNGASAEADVVIAKAGLHSTLQKYVIKPSKPEYSGSRAYRGLLDAEKLPNWRKEAHQVWIGGKHFMVFPVRSGRLINYGLKTE